MTLRKNAIITFGNNSGATASLFVAASKITVGNNVLIGANCTIIDNDFHNINPHKRDDSDYQGRSITIEDNVFIGFNCFILKGVTIGENSIIGANSVVINSIPKNTIAIGNPCKVIITRKWD
ncbi:MAG TPA: DapH/DapD/GlmU-related protein [Bacteroidales bacterium]|nr:DapH/DapD/GlmU-related protein [Bacteroidales bacterium]